ncbi:MAG: hypothetical protein E2O39_01970 [Planctomycetota bacterium]|nr:MAG: hypothetical protein E2O39_01970 [Planctomycetota bacterium]
MDARDELSSTVLILTSDHGEEFMEHGQVGHQRTLHIESLHDPLIVVAPTLERRVVEAGASLADVMPTILELLDIGLPPSLLGRSRPALARGGTHGVPGSGGVRAGKALRFMCRGDSEPLRRSRRGSSRF